ncbi:MAG: Smr/MutS family protein [Gemmatimonadota bacterium]|nr:Smr/MutS family protein [Gemmatimonadota bacterium]
MRSLPPRAALDKALDEARFGAARTLNLRPSLPTVWEATMRTDAWLRQQQASGATEVLVITGRGKGSAGGVSPVRTAVVGLLAQLQRKGIVSAVREHTAGSFIVMLAPFRAAIAARGGNHPPVRPPHVLPDPQALSGLPPQTRALLRSLATRALIELGVRAPESAFVEDEMLRQFARLIPAVAEGPDRDAHLRDAIEAALEALDE